MTNWIGRKAAAAVGSLSAGLLGILSLWTPGKQEALPPVKVLFAYPITYLDPTLYDDWETVFIGNHIYRRLLPEEDNPAIPALAGEVNIACSEPAGADVGPACLSVRVAFKPESFIDCAGRPYRLDDIRKEFESLLAAKSWVLPGWRRCPDATDRVCVIGRNTGEVRRRLRNLNFRFGWSKRRKDDPLIGSGPYCLRAPAGNTGTPIEAGTLAPLDGNPRLPTILFGTGRAGGHDFNVALYGSKELLRGKRRNVQAHTPLAYYVVTNPSLADLRLPWNAAATRAVIAGHFVRLGVFFSKTSGFERLVPEGAALRASRRNLPAASTRELVIPDYLPACKELAAALADSWRGTAKARCVDIVAYVQGRVREKRGGWSAFLVGLSPSDPGRDALTAQYFSRDSTDSLTYDHPHPENLFYLAGIGQSLVTVDGERVCDLRPNPLGLGDIFITDLVGCKR